MIGRRGILGFLASAPVAAPMAIQEAVTGSAIVGGGLNGAIKEDRFYREANDVFQGLMDKVHKSDAMSDPLPESIAGRKSWSREFKIHVAKKEVIKRRMFARELEELMYGNLTGLDRLVALRDFAKRLEAGQ